MDAILQDLRYALRSLIRSPGLFAIAIISLGLGVAANTTIFSAVDVFLYRPLPYPEPDDLYQVWTTNEERGWTESSSSIPDYLDWRAQSRTVDVTAYYRSSFDVSGGDQPERVDGVRVSHNFFTVVGISPARGRAFLPEEEQQGNNVLVISHRFWQRHFGGAAGVLNQTLLVDGEPHVIVGVTGEVFEFPDNRSDLFLPLAWTGEETRDSRYVQVLARSRGGADSDAVQADLSRIGRELATAYPVQNRGIGVNAVPLHDQLFDEQFWTASMICTVAVGFVLLIACANIANLLLARAAAREREIAIRTVLGAGRFRILRQLLTESMVLAIGGGALGALLSVWGIRWLVSMMPEDFSFVERIHLDGRALAFTLGITILSGLLFGLAPALQSARPQLNETLRESGGRGSTLGARKGRMRSALVVSEIGMALVLLVAAGLLVKGYLRMREAELGFQPERVLTAQILLSAARYPDTLQVTNVQSQLLERFRAIPRVTAAGATTILPLMGATGTYYDLVEKPSPDPSQRPVAQYRGIHPGYLDALRIPLRSGRDFTAQDRVGGAPVMLVNESFARLNWPDANPLGRRVALGSGPREIVGVVGDTRDFGQDDDPEPTIFLPATARAFRDMAFVLHYNGDTEPVAEALRTQVRAIDADLPVYQLATLSEIIERETRGDLIMAKLLGWFAFIALVMAVLGVYGVMAYNVAQRTQEVGIRMALGAQARDIIRLVVREGAVLAIIGLTIGIALAAATARFLAAFLFGVSPFDPVTFVSVTAALAIAALVASYVPARRATRVDPVLALRNE